MKKTRKTGKATKKSSQKRLRRASPSGSTDAAAHIDARIKELNDWRGRTLARLRTLIRHADPAIIEEWKWDVPVWSTAGSGIVCTGESYKNAVKLTFARGALLSDPSRLFNSSLEGRTRRAIDVHEGDEINEEALGSLIRAAVRLNTSLSAGS